jgi:aspartate kinase
MNLIVQKFGGATLADLDKIKSIATRISILKSIRKDLIIIVSAMGKTTDLLIAKAHELSPHPNQRELDVLLSTGEIISAANLAIALNELDCPAISLTGAQAGILTDKVHSNANINLIEGVKIEHALKENKVVILAGFQGVGADGDITTLGRGGSDTTALAIAAHFKADRCEILKDFPSIFSADPQIIKNAYPIKSLSYDQLLEMTFWGAKVLQYRSVEIAKNYKVPLYVGSASSDVSGTMVSDLKTKGESEIFAINSHENILKILSPIENLSDAIDWLQQLLQKINIPFPQLLHTERSSSGIDLFVTAPVETLSAITNEMQESTILFELVSSVTTTCRSSISPDLMENVIGILENKNISVMYMILSTMSITIFIKPQYRRLAIDLLHTLVKETNEE